MKNSLKIIATSALLLTASSAMAGLLSSPMGINFSNSELAPVNVQRLDESIIRVHTTGLTGELTISKVNSSGNDESPPSWDTATTEKVVLPFEQELQFDIDYADGIVSGRSTANIYDQSSPLLVVTAEVRGKATQRCGCPSRCFGSVGLFALSGSKRSGRAI